RLLGMNGPAAEPGTPLPNDGSVLHGAFVVQLVQRLRDQDPNVTPALLWLEARLASLGTTVEADVHDEHQRQGGSNVTVRNIITSMRLISELKWSDLFESVSLIDDALSAGSDFAQMDFATRNLYRSAIETLARGSKLTEMEIARAAMVAVGEGTDAEDRRRDPGYHLIGG